ncbi:MAG: hypothetical protein Fur0024_2520 [Patescibacteria group bacterium]
MKEEEIIKFIFGGYCIEVNRESFLFNKKFPLLEKLKIFPEVRIFAELVLGVELFNSLQNIGVPIEILLILGLPVMVRNFFTFAGMFQNIIDYIYLGKLKFNNPSE